MFYKYWDYVCDMETDFLYEDHWSSEEWSALSDMFHERGKLNPEEARDLYWKNHPPAIVQIPTNSDHPDARPCTLFTGHLCKGHDGKCPR